MHTTAHQAAHSAPRRGHRHRLGLSSLAGQLMWVQLGLVVVLVCVAGLALVLQSRTAVMREAEHRSRAVAETFAQAPGTVRALDGSHPSAVLQPWAERVRRKTDVDAVVVFSRQGIRYTHPDPALIGKHVVGPYKPALTEGTFTRTAKVSTGITVVSIVPVTRNDGSVAGFVSVGITVKRLQSAEAAHLPVLLGGAACAFLLSAAATVLVGRRLRRQTHGLGPIELTRMYEHHDAVLHAVREGVLIMDADHRLLLVNDEARRLLSLGPGREGERVADLGMDQQIVDLLTGDAVVSDAVGLAGDRLLAINIRPTDAAGGPAGSVATLRDTTELRALSGRAEAARERLRLLHDAGARVGTTLDVRRTAQEMAEVAVPWFADLVTVELADRVMRGDEPSLPGDPLRRTAVSARRSPGGGTSAVGRPADEDTAATASGASGTPRAGRVPQSPASSPVPSSLPFPVDELVTYGLPAPQAQAMETHEAVLEPDLAGLEERLEGSGSAGRIREPGLGSLITVPVLARGVVLGVANFWRYQASGPFDEDDLSLAEELVGRAGISIDNARRFTREHTTAATLHSSLLPGALPHQEAVEAAYRYLPAQAEQAGVGGDWFDVIPLPGARVALVVGDVVGHSLHAAATMGRLQTAVQSFSALDLPPDELLGCLDELVTKIDDNVGPDAAQISGATCLYVIYDPASGHCTIATNGHPGPALVQPDGTVSFPDIPVSPPLGLGGEPFEKAELDLPEGSRLVLFTNGLVADRERDFDTGMEQLRQALAGLPDGTPEETCQGILDAVLPPHPSDDVALLVARTLRLDVEHIAEWTVDRDPAAVAQIRTEAADRLAAWGLEEVGFATELILSELVTNAIRYSSGPIQVRLMRTRSLICEVADGSTTAPHLRRAATTDEGGRGLYLVSQFAQRWGTRYLDRGKIVWTEQSLVADALPANGVTDDALLDQWDDSGW
ncbi:SpoIIE family protein phosphatase [Streptomyces sp. NBC_01280]|uniref:SpoIIE family protein phosphatase n=1 Tax=unclassified Streptomyces TaxID=2593676 RepID=UPI002E35DFC6|nr:SpoIIE family protein phosphatase [Streptomyces sp. NBC_01280]